MHEALQCLCKYIKLPYTNTTMQIHKALQPYINT